MAIWVDVKCPRCGTDVEGFELGPEFYPCKPGIFDETYEVDE